MASIRRSPIRLAARLALLPEISPRVRLSAPCRALLLELARTNGWSIERELNEVVRDTAVRELGVQRTHEIMVGALARLAREAVQAHTNEPALRTAAVQIAKKARNDHRRHPPSS